MSSFSCGDIGIFLGLPLLVIGINQLFFTRSIYFHWAESTSPRLAPVRSRNWMKGLKYKIMLEEYIVYYNEDKLYSQNTETEEVYVSEPDPDQPGYLQAVPIKIIKAYEQDFNYMYIGNTPMLGKSLIEIQLYPKDISGPYSMLKMFVNPGSQKLEVIQLKHKEGILYTMILSEMKVDPTLKESVFDFDPLAFPNTEIIELIE